MLEGILIVIGSILMILGLAGSVLPVLPGPPLSFIGLLLLAFVEHFSPPLTPTLIIVLGVVMVLMIVMDYVLPLLGAKKYGSSKWGAWGSVLGMVIGVFWSPFGMLVGAFVGAIVGEWLAGKKGEEALKAGWGVMVGTMFATIFRLGISGIMTYYFVLALLK
jgi:uncharacterized protein